ncbi:hypothetical protein WJX75_002525 [Coccomyxa subellipsoidea]|uniref:Uncharacterized protein n=1 Tax=Coccomyxa subellipsoidea TaxID=248742 RepID=A0ABR2YHF0_9CHLO
MFSVLSVLSCFKAAIECLEFLSGIPDGFFADKAVLELGCGLGVVGQLRGARVTLTDRTTQLPILQHNVGANFSGQRDDAPRVAVLDWTDLPEWALQTPWDLIIASDVAYDEDCFAPLIDCLSWLSCPARQSHAGTKIILALPDRPETLLFFSAADVAGMTWRRLSHFSRPDLATPLSIYQFVQRPCFLEVCRQIRPHSSTTEASPSKRCKVANATQARTMVVFDFDWSLVEENSDTWVLDQLGATEIFKQLKATVMPWTELMDASLLAAHEKLGKHRQDIAEACASTPFAACMRQAVVDLAARGCDLVIVSDANSFFIEAILQHHGLLEHFKEVHTNRATWEGGALHVRPHHQGAEPHGCPNCPANLCKGKVMEQLLLQQNYSRVVFLGDGAGDLCPSTRLGPRDFVLSREFYPTGAPCSLLRLAKSESARVTACFRGAGPLDAAAADPAALAAAAEADGCTAAHAHAPLGAGLQ